jgi:NhaA family Na+:H+ antiporter
LLLLAAAGFAIVRILNEVGVRSVPVYLIAGVFIWLAVCKSGVNPTVVGVLLGLLTPSEAWVGRDALRLSLTDVAAQLDENPAAADAAELELMAFAAKESVSPLERLELQLHPWVGFVIMPVFALANAGVHVELNAITEPVAVAVALGLLLGKPTGVMLFSFLAVKIGLAKLPQGVTWPMLLGGGFLAGIGFTMSLFVAGLAFETHANLLTNAKIGILVGSLLSAVIGAGLLILTLRK